MENYQEDMIVAIMLKKKKMKALLKTYTFRDEKLKRYEMVWSASAIGDHQEALFLARWPNTPSARTGWRGFDNLLNKYFPC